MALDFKLRRSLSQQLLCSQQPNKRLLSAPAISILFRPSRSLKTGLSNRVIPHTASLRSERRRSESSSHLHSTRCCQRRRRTAVPLSGGSHCAHPWAPLSCAQRRPLVTRENTHRSAAMRHQATGTRRSLRFKRLRVSIAVIKRDEDEMEHNYVFRNQRNGRGRG